MLITIHFNDTTICRNVNIFDKINTQNSKLRLKNKYINIIINSTIYIKMLLHLPTFPSILKFIIIHQPVHILSVLPKPFGNAEKRSFLS